MEAVQLNPYYRQRLKEELTYRIEKNPKYSLRSFAEALGIGSGPLSQILSGKRSVSIKVIERIFESVELSPLEQKKFIESVMAEKNGLERISAKLRSRLHQLSQASVGSVEIDRTLGMNEFRVISDWYYAAILELTFAKDFQSDPRWIARSLGITEMEAKLAIERLSQLDLLELNEGRLKKSNFNLDTKDKSKTSAFLKRRQKQILDKSAHSLENDPIEQRNHSAFTVCIDPAMIPEAKQRIQKFMWELGQLLVTGEPNRVYELCVNLFPLQKEPVAVNANFGE